MVNTCGVRVCCDNRLNLAEDKELIIMVSREETCVVRKENSHHIGNWTIKKMPADIPYIVTVTAVTTGETVIFPSTDICYRQLEENSLESTELIDTIPKDLVIVFDTSMNQSIFKDSKGKWLDAQHSMPKQILDLLSENDRLSGRFTVIVVEMQNGRNFTTSGCLSKTLGVVDIEKKFKPLARDDYHWDNTNSDLSAMTDQLEEVFQDFPTLQHKRDKIAVLFVALTTVTKENNTDTWIENPFLNRITLLSVCIGNITGSSTDAVMKQHLKKYGSYLGVSSMAVNKGFADWFKKSILPTGTTLASKGLFPGIGPVLKVCRRKEDSFVCLLVPVADIHMTVGLSRYIKSHWILLDEFCRVLIHPKSSYTKKKVRKGSASVTDDLPLYEPQLRIDMSKSGCNITPKLQNSQCQKIEDTKLTLCLIVNKDDGLFDLTPKVTLNGQSSNTQTKGIECLYHNVVLRTSPTETLNRDSLKIQQAGAVQGRNGFPSNQELKKKKRLNVKSLVILKKSIKNPKGALSTFVGFIDGVFIMDPGSSYIRPVDYTTKQWFQVARQNPKQIIVLPLVWSPMSVDRPIIWPNPTITIARAIQIGESGESLLGVFGMVFDFETFEEVVFKPVLSKFCAQKSCVVIDQEGFIIYPQKVDWLQYPRDKFHITVQEPDLAESLIHENILQRSFCTNIERSQKVVTWKVEPSSINGSKILSKGKTIHSINQTNLHVVVVEDKLERKNEACVCRNNPNDPLCCPKRIVIELCEQKSLPGICPPEHPHRFIAVEIKPTSKEGRNITRCPFIECEDLTFAGARTCRNHKCNWCKVNHEGIVSYWCSEDKCSSAKIGTTATVSTSHSSEKYIWMGVAGAVAIILLLCVIVVCHMRTCLKDSKKDEQKSAEIEISHLDSISQYPAPDFRGLGVNLYDYEPSTEDFSIQNSTHSRRQPCSHVGCPSSSGVSSGITTEIHTLRCSHLDSISQYPAPDFRGLGVNLYEPSTEGFSLPNSTHSRRQPCSYVGCPSSASSAITTEIHTLRGPPGRPLGLEQGVILHGHLDSCDQVLTHRADNLRISTAL